MQKKIMIKYQYFENGHYSRTALVSPFFVKHLVQAKACYAMLLIESVCVISVCLSISLSVCVQDNLKSYGLILIFFLPKVQPSPRNNPLNFGDDLDHDPDARIFERIL